MSTKKKYEFTGETLQVEGHILKRIRYLKKSVFFNLRQLGGWIESESNLSHEGECCVLNDAMVFGSAIVKDNARVSLYGMVKDNAQLRDSSIVSDDAIVCGDTILTNVATVIDNSYVCFYADKNYGKPNIHGDSLISGATVIKATGQIFESNIDNSILLGYVNLVGVVWENETL